MFSLFIHIGFISVPLTGLMRADRISIADLGNRIQVKFIKEISNKNKGMTKQLAQRPQMAKRKALNKGTERYTGQKNNSPKLPPKLYHPAPSYPLLARQKGWQGKVLIKIWSDEQGKITKRKLQQSSGFDILDQAAFDSLAQWKTLANLHDQTVPFIFTLKKNI